MTPAEVRERVLSVLRIWCLSPVATPPNLHVEAASILTALEAASLRVVEAEKEQRAEKALILIGYVNREYRGLLTDRVCDLMEELVALGAEDAERG